MAHHRVFLAGYQCGGTMAFRIGLKYPHRFAGVLVAWAVHFPPETRLWPIWMKRESCRSSLRKDALRELYPVEQTCDELRLFHSAGMHVTLRQYPCGDELNTQMLHDMNVWMMEQVTGITSEAEDLSPRYGDEN